jgi:predicted DNA-binding transcriptional regulator AlpA
MEQFYMAIKPEISQSNSLPDEALIRMPMVKALFSCSQNTIYSRITKGFIPQPLRLSERCIAWRAGDIRKALSSIK